MKIVHVVRTLDPAAGGLPVVPARLAAAQAAIGNSVSILAERDRAAVSVVPALLAGVPGGDHVRTEWLTPANWSALFGLGRVYAELNGLLTAAEVVHLHGVWEPVVWAAARTASAIGRPYLIAPHGMLDPWSLAQKRWKKRLALALGWRGILNCAAALHLLNADEQRLLTGLGLSASTVIIPNGVFLEEVGFGVPGTFPARNDRLKGRPYVLFLSRLHYKKGLDVLADAFRIVAGARPDVLLVVAGPDDGARSDFERRVQAHGLTERVVFVGSLSGQAKWDCLAGATCFCLPSRQEGFSMAVLEALASGIPAVISEACHFPEVAEVGAGVVVPLDAAAVAAGLMQVLSDSDLRQRMGAAGQRLVSERFTWRRAAERSIEAYDRALAP